MGATTSSPTCTHPVIQEFYRAGSEIGERRCFCRISLPPRISREYRIYMKSAVSSGTPAQILGIDKTMEGASYLLIYADERTKDKWSLSKFSTSPTQRVV